jgi:hypothetical protein
MQFQAKLAVALVATISPSLASLPLQAQGVGHYLAPRDQIVAIRAGHLFDSRSGNLLDNQVVLVRGERIAEVGSARSRYRRVRQSSTLVRRPYCPA